MILQHYAHVGYGVICLNKQLKHYFPMSSLGLRTHHTATTRFIFNGKVYDAVAAVSHYSRRVAVSHFQFDSSRVVCHIFDQSVILLFVHVTDSRDYVLQLTCQSVNKPQTCKRCHLAITFKDIIIKIYGI